MATELKTATAITAADATTDFVSGAGASGAGADGWWKAAIGKFLKMLSANTDNPTGVRTDLGLGTGDSPAFTSITVTGSATPAANCVQIGWTSNRAYLYSGGATLFGWDSVTGDSVLNQNYQLVFGSSALNSPDVGIKRAAADVIGVTNATTAGGRLSAKPYTVSTITANQTDYAGFAGKSMFVRVATDADWNIYSMTAGAPGEFFYGRNVGNFNLIFKHDDGSTGTAAQRINGIGNADVSIGPGETWFQWYDDVTSRWNVE